MGNTPNVRFKGFTEDWEQRKLGDLVIIERGGSPRPINKFITEDENGLNWVKIGDAPERGNYITQTKEKIRYEGLSKTREVHPGDLILSNSMSFGRPYIMAIDGCIHDGWLLIRDNEKRFDLKYLCYMLGTDMMLSQYKQMAAGSTVNNLNKELVGNTVVKYPSPEEQSKMGDYFSIFDNLITLHQQKCDETKEFKKYMLQNMFPQKDEKVPKIRFDGFTGDWEQRKVLDLLIQPITDGPHETPKLVEKGVPFISVDAIVDNKIDFNRKRGNISEEYDELCCKKYKPQFHDVYLVKSGSTVGKVAIVETTDRFNIWSPLAAMRCGEKTYPYFLYDLLQTKDLQAQVADKASNGTQPNLSMRELEKFPVSVPSNLEEQKKIGDYFRSFDHLITLHQQKCNALKEFKKYMLQNMFPQKGKNKCQN